MLYLLLTYYVLTLAWWGIPLYSYWEQLSDLEDYKHITNRPILTAVSVILFCWLFPFVAIRGKK